MYISAATIPPNDWRIPFGNLAGDAWAGAIAKDAQAHGRNIKQTKRDRPLTVSGVGKGNEGANFNGALPVAFKSTDGTYKSGVMDTPIIRNSELPGLLGLKSLEKLRAVIDFTTGKMYLMGPGDPEFDFPPGTECFQLERAPSGHLLLPCHRYQGFDEQQATGGL